MDKYAPDPESTTFAGRYIPAAGEQKTKFMIKMRAFFECLNQMQKDNPGYKLNFTAAGITQLAYWKFITKDMEPKLKAFANEVEDNMSKQEKSKVYMKIFKEAMQIAKANWMQHVAQTGLIDKGKVPHTMAYSKRLTALVKKTKKIIMKKPSMSPVPSPTKQPQKAAPRSQSPAKPAKVTRTGSPAKPSPSGSPAGSPAQPSPSGSPKAHSPTGRSMAERSPVECSPAGHAPAIRSAPRTPLQARFWGADAFARSQTKPVLQAVSAEAM